MKFTTNAVILFLTLSLSSSSGKLLRGGHTGTESPTASMYPSTAPSTSPITEAGRPSPMSLTKNPVPQLMSYEMANELLEVIPIPERTDQNNRKLSSIDDTRFPAGDDNLLLGAFSVASGNADYSPFQEIIPCDDSAEYDTSACIETVPPTVPSTDLSTTIDDKSSRKDYIKSSVSAEGGAFGASLSTSASFMTSSQMSTKSISYMLSGTINHNITRVRNPSQLKLTNIAKNWLVNDTIRFLEIYGTNFVSTIGSGGAFAGAFTLSADSSEQQNEIDVQVSASYDGGLFSASGSAAFDQQRSSSSFKMTVSNNYKSLPEMETERDAIDTPLDLSKVYENWSNAAAKNPAPLYVSLNAYAVSNDVMDNVPIKYLKKFLAASFSPAAIETATLEQLQTELLISSISNILEWPGIKGSKIYKGLTALKTNATSYYTLYTSNFTDVSLYELQNQLINPEATASNKFSTWLYYSQPGGLSDQFSTMNPYLIISYAPQFGDALPGFQCCQENYFLDTGKDSAKTPAYCETACTNDQRCKYFDHSTNNNNCLLCSSCLTTTGSSTKYYTSYQKQMDIYSSVESIDLLPPPDPAYIVKYEGSMCCRAKHIAYTKSNTPYQCEANCSNNPDCNFVDHSDHFNDCYYCKTCDHTTGGDNDYYNSFAKVNIR